MAKLNIDQSAVEAYVAYVSKLTDDYDLTGTYKYTYEAGYFYIRIVKEGNGQRVVHSFLANKETDKFKLGDILKAHNWKRPVKQNPRGNILAGTLERVHWTGIR